MDDSFGAAMAGLVIEDASRMSGARFADARGTGVARRVRTRRRVRAAGMGGASAVAVGALALGASHMPWGALETAPGIGVTDCATQSPSDDAYVYEVIVRQGVAPVDTVSLTDAATGATFLTATLQSDGTYVFTDADGNPLRAAADESSGSYWVFGPQVPPDSPGTAAPGAAEIQVKSVSSTKYVGAPSAVANARDDCYTPNPTPPGDASMSASPTPAASLAAKTEDVVAGTNPFECGFEFDAPVRAAVAGGVAGYEWVDPETLNASRSDRVRVDGDLLRSRNSAPVPVAHIVLASEEYPSFAMSFGVGTPQDQAGDLSMSEETLFIGASFVQARDGVVVGTMKVDQASAMRNFSFAVDSDSNVLDLALVDANNAFLACPGETLEASGLSTYAVAGSFTGYPASTDFTPIEYSWVAIEAE